MLECYLSEPVQDSNMNRKQIKWNPCFTFDSHCIDRENGNEYIEVDYDAWIGSGLRVYFFCLLTQINTGTVKVPVKQNRSELKMS